jgi:hypothetical protein
MRNLNAVFGRNLVADKIVLKIRYVAPQRAVNAGLSRINEPKLACGLWTRAMAICRTEPWKLPHCFSC